MSHRRIGSPLDSLFERGGDASCRTCVHVPWPVTKLEPRHLHGAVQKTMNINGGQFDFACPPARVPRVGPQHGVLRSNTATAISARVASLTKPNQLHEQCPFEIKNQTLTSTCLTKGCRTNARRRPCRGGGSTGRTQTWSFPGCTAQNSTSLARFRDHTIHPSKKRAAQCRVYRASSTAWVCTRCSRDTVAVDTGRGRRQAHVNATNPAYVEMKRGTWKSTCLVKYFFFASKHRPRLPRKLTGPQRGRTRW